MQKVYKPIKTVSEQNIIVLTRIKQSRRDLKKFGYGKIKSKNYQLWDISEYTSQVTHEWNFENIYKKSDKIKRIKNKFHFEKEIEKIENKKNHFVVDKSRLWKNKEKVRKLENRVSKFGNLSEKYGKVHPIRNKKRGYKELLKSYFKYYKRALGNEIKRRSKTKSKYIFIPTSWDIGRIDRVGLTTSIKKIHTEEYDEFILSEKNEREEKRAVFIDQSIPYHIDLIRKYGKGWIDEKKYYKSVKQFLRKMESEIDLKKSVVSVHPHTELGKIKRHFEERKAIKRKTPELVRSSKIVVTHFSTAALYSVMDMTNICFLTTESLSKVKEHEHIKDMSKMFGRKVNMVGDKKVIDYGVDKKKNREIMRRLVKAPGTPSVNSWEYVYNTLVN